MLNRAPGCCAAALALLCAPAFAGEGGLDPFLGPAKFDVQKLFEGERCPNIVVAMDGTVIASWGEVEDNFALGEKGIRVRRSEDGGRTWGPLITVTRPCWHGGGLTVDETTGDILAFAEAKYPPAPVSVHRSRDHGKTWKPDEGTVIGKDALGHRPDMHFAEHGITLRHGKHRGRLLRAARWFAGADRSPNLPKMYDTAIYSDDGGRTWRTSAPFPELGTGEGAVAELSDGRIYYNARRHWDPPDAEYDRSMRWTAWSDDGGATWKDAAVSTVLPDGARKAIRPGSGCLGGLVRLPVKGRDILLYSNCDSHTADRQHVTVWGSFDGAKTWPVKRRVFNGPSAYSSLTAGRPGTPSEGWICILLEGGKTHRYEDGYVARFNLAWLLAGEKTGDGNLPAWVGVDIASGRPQLPWNALPGGGLPPNTVSGPGTTVRFENRSQRAVQLHWIKYNGSPVPYGVLPPGGSREQGTTANSSWLITGVDGRPLGYFRATREPAAAVIPKVLPESILRARKYSPRSASEARNWQQGLRSELRKLLAIEDWVAGDRPPLQAKILSSEDRAGYRFQELEINSTPAGRIKVVLTLPAKAARPGPAVVAIAGHSGTRHSCHGKDGFATRLAERGYATVSTRISQHGIRENGRTMMGERLWDLMRCVDLLASLPEVDARRIGCAGNSLGGEMAMWLAAMDERIAATVSAGFLTRMDQLEQNHCRCWKFAGLRELVDFSDIYALTAPRALQCQNGLKERPTWFTVPIAREALAEIRPIYADLGAPQHLDFVAHEGGHVIDLPRLLAFFKQHLEAPE